jgi:hypothetical protein
MPNPEDKARENIDRLLTQPGWAVRDQSEANILVRAGMEIESEKYTSYGNKRK